MIKSTKRLSQTVSLFCNKHVIDLHFMSIIFILKEQVSNTLKSISNFAEPKWIRNYSFGLLLLLSLNIKLTTFIGLMVEIACL